MLDLNEIKNSFKFKGLKNLYLSLKSISLLAFITWTAVSTEEIALKRFCKKKSTEINPVLLSIGLKSTTAIYYYLI